MNSAFILAIAILVFGLGFRFYSKFLALKIAKLDDEKPTPAVRFNDGKDYVPMKKWTVFFYHYATIAGAGVLIGPTLAAQYGWLPCILWILAATCLAGGVHDFMVMYLSVKYDGKSIGDIAKREVGFLCWIAVICAAFFMIIMAIAGMGVGLISALKNNPWATFTVMATVPIALFIYAYENWIRKGKFQEGAIIGLGLLIIVLLTAPELQKMGLLNIFDLRRERLIVLIGIYSLFASIIPVHILLAPRDHLSGTIKVSGVMLITIALLIMHPTFKMPPLTVYATIGGPVVPGTLWPFLFIVITCGAISGWHTLCCSGVSPRLIAKESHIRTIGYGGWLLESMIAVVALCLACTLFPGDYFAINANPKVYAGIGMNPVELQRFSELIGMDLQGRVGGVSSLSVSVANLLSDLFKRETTLAFWYQFMIVFMGIFIMPIMDHGTRMARYFVQDALGITPKMRSKWWFSTIILAFIAVFLWGYLLWTGTIGILWPMFGICNQLMACIGLIIATSYILKHFKPLYGLIAFWPVIVFASASIHGAGIRILKDLLPSGTTPAYVQMSLLLLFIVLFCLVLIEAARSWLKAFNKLMPPSKKQSI